MDDLTEQYLLETLEETKRLVIAYSVLSSLRLDKQQLDQEILTNLLTMLMVSLGYRLPTYGGYRLPDYTALCDWLGSTEEDGKQRWDGG